MLRIGWFAIYFALAGCLGVPAYLGPGDAAEAGDDEDNDTIPDNVDLCPHIDRPQNDLDLDGIGDDCDPNPADMASPDIKLFYGFKNKVTGDLLKDGAFVVQDGAVLLGATGSSGDSKLQVPHPFRDTQIEIGFEVVAAGDSGAGNIAVQMSEPAGQPLDGGNCAISPANTSQIYMAVGWGTTNGLSTVAGPPAYDVLEGHLRGRYKANIVDCVADELAPNGGPFHGTWDQSPVAVTGPASVHAISVQIRVLYIFVAGRP